MIRMFFGGDGRPDWTTVTVWSPAVMTPVLVLPELFFAREKDTVALPVPFPTANEIHEAAELAVHAQPDCVAVSEKL